METATMSATARYEEELHLLQADERAFQELQERLNQGQRLSHEDENRFGTLERSITHSRERLLTLEAQKRQERAVVDVTALTEDWQPLMESKIQAYDTLSLLVQQV